MTISGDPFRQAQVPYLNADVYAETRYPPAKQAYNTLAVLSPVFAVVFPPVGAVLGHLALVQMRRSGEPGRTAAIWGLILGYLLTAALVLGLILWAVSKPADTVAICTDGRRHGRSRTVAGGPAAGGGDFGCAAADQAEEQARLGDGHRGHLR